MERSSSTFRDEKSEARSHVKDELDSEVHKKKRKGKMMLVGFGDLRRSLGD